MTSMINLSPQELQKANAYADKIDLNNTSVIMQYAAPVQRKITSYSSQALDIASGNSSTQAIDVIQQLTERIRNFSTTRKGFLGLGRLTRDDWRQAYQETSGIIRQLALQLEGLQFQLYKDMGLYQAMAQKNQEARQELLLYLQAGQTRLATAKELELPMLTTRLQTTRSAEVQLNLTHYQGQVEQFEKKLQDLHVTKIISEQFESQLDLMYQSARTLSEKLQQIISHTIPLWQNQVSIALGLDRIEQARAADRMIRETPFDNPGERIEQLTERILKDIDNKKAELQELEDKE